MTEWAQKLEEEPFFWQRIAVLFLMGTLSLISLGEVFNYDLVLVALLGFFLCSKGGLRGWGYALAALIAVSIVKHVRFEGAHAWQLGLETSVGFALLITALSEEQGKSFLASLEEHLGTRTKTIQNLEEEIGQLQKESAKAQAEASERLSEQRLALDDQQSELSSIQILNEVLRKNMAQAGSEKEALQEANLQLHRKMGHLLHEIDSLQKELQRLSQESRVVEQNRQLFKELNDARVKEAETHLAHEATSRLHAKEKKRADEGEARVALAERQVEHVAQELESLQEIRSRLEAMQTERNFLRERLERAEEELAHRQEAPLPSLEPMRSTEGEQQHLLTQIAELREQLAALSKTEPLYRQLRQQFEEKNRVLHETRVLLFRSDTELQRLSREAEEKGLHAEVIPSELRLEVEAIALENESLQEENLELQQLVTHLMAASPVKKK